MKGMKSLAFVALVITCLGAAQKSQQERDFEYKDLPLFKVIEGLAKLQGKNVMFGSAVENRPVTLSLSGVTPAFAMKLILENSGYMSVNRGPDVIQIISMAERGIAGEASTSIIPLRNVIAKDLLANIQGFVGPGASISVNEQLNAFIISAPDDTLARIRRLVSELDQEVIQIFIEAKVIETSTRFSRDLGIEWGTPPRAAGDVTERTLERLNVSVPGANTAFFAVVNTAGLQARLSAGEEGGDVKVISSPKITTLNGVAAHIQSATTFSIRTLAAVGGSGQGTAAVGGIQNVRAGVSLSVTPYVVSEDQVRLTIDLTKSDPDFGRAVDNIPGISDNSARTSLIVKNGQMASIGGLINHSESHNYKRVPILGDLPILGYLFGNDFKAKDKKELLIFITPTVFKGERKEVAAEIPEQGGAAGTIPGEVGAAGAIPSEVGVSTNAEAQGTVTYPRPGITVRGVGGAGRVVGVPGVSTDAVTTAGAAAPTSGSVPAQVTNPTQPASSAGNGSKAKPQAVSPSQESDPQRR